MKDQLTEERPRTRISSLTKFILRSLGDKEFVQKYHDVDRIEDVAGNTDDVYQATNVKSARDTPQNSRMGYKPNETGVTEADLSEVSKDKLVRYNQKAVDDLISRTHKSGKKGLNRMTRQEMNRRSGIHKASEKLYGKYMRVPATEEKLTEFLNPKLGGGKYFDDAIYSSEKRYAGKTKHERIRMALGEWYSKHKGKLHREETDLDESYESAPIPYNSGDSETYDPKFHHKVWDTYASKASDHALSIESMLNTHRDRMEDHKDEGIIGSSHAATMKHLSRQLEDLHHHVLAHINGHMTALEDNARRKKMNALMKDVK